jgi:DNA-directed RNA polymerase subunit RPC12/RpoP
MERSPNTLKLENENSHTREDRSDFKCDECGEEFHHPLLARNSSHGSVQTYYACPRCLTQVKEDRKQQVERSEEAPISLKELKRSSAKPEENVSCQHFFGYLGKRPKDTAIPEDCLVCEKMIECMIH